MDMGILEKIRQETSVLSREEVMLIGKEVHIYHFEIDTSGLDIDQADRGIYSLLQEVGKSETMEDTPR